MNYAKSSFKASRKLYGEAGGNQGYVIIQSSKPDEVTPGRCNQLGLELAEKLAPSHQVTMYTHSDTDHIHNYIVINSIDLKTGKKFNNNRQALRNVRNFNDEICREHGLSVPECGIAKLRYTQAEEALIEKDQYSWKDDLRERIRNARGHTSDFKSFSEHLEKPGIEFKARGKSVSYKPENVNKWVRGKTLSEDCDKGALKYEFERREREEEKEPERDAVAAYIDRSGVDWDAVKRNTEQFRKTRIRRIKKTKQAHRQVSSRDTRKPERTRGRTKTARIEFDRDDEGFSR